MGRRSLGERGRRALRHYGLKTRRSLLRPLIEWRLGQIDFRVEDSLIISGVARGGTTWLFELLSGLPGVVPNWEPLNGPNAGNLERWSAGQLPLEELLTLRERGGWQLDYVGPRHLWAPRRVLTKFVRATSLMPALLDQHTFRHRPIVLLRHPIAAADSYVRAWGHPTAYRRWTPRFGAAYDPAFTRHLNELRSLPTQLEFRTAFWCLHHQWLLERPELLGRVRLLRYESLVKAPGATLRPLLDEIAPEVGADAYLSQINFRRPSSSDFAGAFKSDPDLQLNKYAAGNVPEVIARCRAIMARYGDPGGYLRD